MTNLINLLKTKAPIKYALWILLLFIFNMTDLWFTFFTVGKNLVPELNPAMVYLFKLGPEYVTVVKIIVTLIFCSIFLIAYNIKTVNKKVLYICLGGHTLLYLYINMVHTYNISVYYYCISQGLKI